MIFGIKINILWSLLFVLIILVLATFGILTLLWFGFNTDFFSGLKTRIKSWWLLSFCFACVVTLSDTVSLFFLGMLSFLALKEYISIIPFRMSDRLVFFWAYLSIPVQYYWINKNWYGMFIIFIPIYVFLFLPIIMVIIGQIKGFLKAAGTLHWGLMTTVFSTSHMAYLLVLPNGDKLIAGNEGLLLFLVFLTQFNDVMQFLVGKGLGFYKILPKINQNKTWEGMLGGLFATTICAYFLAPFLTPFSKIHSLFLGAMIAVSGFMGDAIITAIKTDLEIVDEIKELDSPLIGQESVLNRIDSLMYTSPLFFHFTYYFYY